MFRRSLNPRVVSRLATSARPLALKQQQRYNTHFFSFGNLGLQGTPIQLKSVFKSDVHDR